MKIFIRESILDENSLDKDSIDKGLFFKYLTNKDSSDHET